MIPKKIHYVWVGDNPLPEEARKYIEGWKQLCPDYEIIEWNNDAVSRIDNLYVQQAFYLKKWAFVSDYLRLYALHTQGGFYFDTDWEMTQSIDGFRGYEFLTGFENYQGKYAPVTALMAAQADNALISALLAEYDDIPFILKNGRENTTPNTRRIARHLEECYGIKAPWEGEKKLIIKEGHVIFPASYFCTPLKGAVNYGIHHYNGSWCVCRRRIVLRIGKFSWVRFKKDPRAKTDNWCILASDEEIVFGMSLSKKIRHCLIKRKSS